MITLPSGAELKITLSPFDVANELLQVVTKEAKGLQLDPYTEMDTNLIKDALCLAISSKEIERCLWKCMERATYNGHKITKATFEAEEARGDYLDVMMEVGRANLLPFLKNLYAKYAQALEKLQKGPA